MCRVIHHRSVYLIAYPLPTYLNACLFTNLPACQWRCCCCRVSPLPLGREPQFSSQLFDEADSNGDGVIDFQEFMLVSKKLLKNWMTMF